MRDLDSGVGGHSPSLLPRTPGVIIALPCTEVHGTALLKHSCLISDRLPLHLLAGLPDRRLGCCVLHNSSVSIQVRKTWRQCLHHAVPYRDRGVKPGVGGGSECWRSCVTPCAPSPALRKPGLVGHTHGPSLRSGGDRQEDLKFKVILDCSLS